MIFRSLSESVSLLLSLSLSFYHISLRLLSKHFWRFREKRQQKIPKETISLSISFFTLFILFYHSLFDFEEKKTKRKPRRKPANKNEERKEGSGRGRREKGKETEQKRWKIRLNLVETLQVSKEEREEGREQQKWQKATIQTKQTVKKPQHRISTRNINKPVNEQWITKHGRQR